MFTEADLNEAVQAGALTPQAVAAFQDFIAGRRAGQADEEQFRLLTGFNDIFVSIAIILFLVGMSFVGGKIAGPTGAGLLTAGTAWLLARYFTAKRRMALPSIMLVFGFVIGGAGAAFGLFAPLIVRLYGAATPAHGAGMSLGFFASNAMVVLMVGVVAAAAALLHWRAFKVPIAVACAAGSAVLIGLALITALIPASRTHFGLLVLLGGVLILALAMRWDLSDPTRRTRRADVAFWLHMLAAPLIVQPLFFGLDLTRAVWLPPALRLAHAAIAIGLYGALIMVALVIDRRAVLVSALIYLLIALDAVVRASGMLTGDSAVIAVAVGGLLLFLSAFWGQSRAALLALLALVPGTGPFLLRLPPVLERVKSG